MDVGNLAGYILDNCLVLIPVLWIVGYILKNTPKMPNWLIPYVLTVLGVAGACGVVGFGVDGVIQGVLVAGGAVLGHQLVRQAQHGGKAE